MAGKESGFCEEMHMGAGLINYSRGVKWEKY